MSTSVLYDAPGPKALRRNRILGVVTVIVVIAVLGFVVSHLATSGQFEAKKWQLFTYPLVWQRVGLALVSTLSAFALAAVLSLVLGVVLAVGRLSDHAWVSRPAAWITELFRAVPLLILMMIIYYGLPTIGVTWVSPFVAVVAGLTMYNGSVLAEVFRSGIQALPKGQAEAGYSIGLRKGQVMRMILLPQAVKSMMPVIISQLVVVLKDTALGFIVTYEELLYVAKFYGAQAQFDYPIIPSAIVIGSIYIGLCLLLSGFAVWLQRRLSRAHR
ncbi:amino acid ABC transporter permease [Pseudoclavibacter sp. CFCC 11306]|uniref:amino acid ABC transporter permease n=1 Tax=Pseudoclavibacter sp. CFCC 11306 TaxID=1564493 RepID=UPI0013016EFD|nr:amino acid ABC transporter permease [Pseudoclavibacter sp. CFCC 11306]KAB1656923.1 amino acid ABC transporter permease [Pseudoclavibacter sp. CFCC 11306]